MSRVSRNIVWNSFGQVLLLILGFVAVRFVYRRLGGDALGLIYFSVTFSAALSLVMQLGICESAVREVAAHRNERSGYIESFVRTTSLFYWIGYLILGVIAWVAAPYLILHWVKLTSIDHATAIKILRILTLGALLGLPIGLYRALVVGLERFETTNVIDVLAKGMEQGGIFLILLMHGSLFYVVYWIIGCTVLSLLVYLWACIRFFSLRAILPGFSLAVVKKNRRYASGLMVISLSAWLLAETDKLMVSKLLPLTLLGVYTFGRGAIARGMLLTYAISGAIFPYFSALQGSGKADEIKTTYNKMQDLICLGTIPVFAIVPFAAIPLFSYVFDPRYAHLLLLPVTFLAIGYYMDGTTTIPYVVSLAVGRPDITAKQNVLAFLLVVPASAIAIYYFGLAGAGFSWVLYHLFTYLYGLPRICRECLGMQVGVWYWHVLRILGSALVIYGCCWLALVLLGNFSVRGLAAVYLLGTIIYCGLAFRLMGDELRHQIIQTVSVLRLKASKTGLLHRRAGVDTVAQDVSDCVTKGGSIE